MSTPRFLNAATVADLRAKLEGAAAEPDGDAQARQLLALQRALTHTMTIYSHARQQLDGSKAEGA